MRKAYCTQNNGDCGTCSLVNYGLDCANNPLSTQAPAQTRYTRMMAAYDGFKGGRTVKAVLDQIPDELQRQLTGKQLGMVMSVVNRAYHNGRASLGGVDIQDDCVWLPWGGRENKGQLIPIAALKSIKVNTTVDKITNPNSIAGFAIKDAQQTTHYTMDYTED